MEDPIKLSIKKFEKSYQHSVNENIENVEHSFQFSEITSEELLSEIDNVTVKKLGLKKIQKSKMHF